MFNIASITRNTHTTDVLFCDGTQANVFTINLLGRLSNGELFVVATGAHTDFNGWLKTLQACVENALSLGEGNVVYADDTCLHTTRGGVSIGFAYDPDMERHLARRDRAWQEQAARIPEHA